MPKAGRAPIASKRCGAERAARSTASQYRYTSRTDHEARALELALDAQAPRVARRTERERQQAVVEAEGPAGRAERVVVGEEGAVTPHARGARGQGLDLGGD